MAVSCERNGRSEGERSVFKGHGRDGEGGERSDSGQVLLDEFLHCYHLLQRESTEEVR